MIAEKILLVLCTAPDLDVANRIAKTVVAERLAACVNRTADIQSVYRWEGKVQSDPEVLLILKTTAEAYGALEKRILELHPYELPEVIAVELSRGLAAYLDWVRDEVK